MDAEADGGVVVPLTRGDEVVPAGWQGMGVAVEAIPLETVTGDFQTGDEGFFREADLDGSKGGFLRLCFQCGQGVGDEGRGVVARVVIDVGFVFALDELNVPRAFTGACLFACVLVFSLYDEEEEV